MESEGRWLLVLQPVLQPVPAVSDPLPIDSSCESWILDGGWVTFLGFSLLIVLPQSKAPKQLRLEKYNNKNKNDRIYSPFHWTAHNLLSHLLFPPHFVTNIFLGPWMWTSVLPWINGIGSRIAWFLEAIWFLERSPPSHVFLSPLQLLYPALFTFSPELDVDFGRLHLQWEVLAFWSVLYPSFLAYGFSCAEQILIWMFSYTGLNPSHPNITPFKGYISGWTCRVSCSTYPHILLWITWTKSLLLYLGPILMLIHLSSNPSNATVQWLLHCLEPKLSSLSFNNLLVNVCFLCFLSIGQPTLLCNWYGPSFGALSELSILTSPSFVRVFPARRELCSASFRKSTSHLLSDSTRDVT